MSENQGSRRRLPRPATVLAAIAVFAVLAGTATAAKTVINGSQIKKGSITAKQIKNKSLTPNKFSAAAINQFKGNQGPRGPQGERGERGPQGEKGAQGAQGPAGIVAPLYGTAGNNNIDANDEEIILTVPVASSGSFLINAKVDLFSSAAGTNVECFLLAGGNQVDDIVWSNDDADSSQPAALLAVATATPAKPIQLGCGFNGAGGGAASDAHIAAVPVS